MKGNFPTERFSQLKTPFYYYDMALLARTLDVVRAEAGRYGYRVHYALKANANPRILSAIAAAGLGADCVSGGEIQAALAAGFPPSSVVFAGVGKADWEIDLGLENDIFCFNVESAAELEVLNERALAHGVVAPVALRVNPEVDAHTHAKITTGLKENKFGINIGMLDGVLSQLAELRGVRLIGVHCHIGSQITDISVFRDLAIRMEEILGHFYAAGFDVPHVNFGGGLGVDYSHPNHLCVPTFDSYFAAFHKLFQPRPGQVVHFEPGRSVVAQCGSLITKALYVKEGETRRFAIVDAGFTDLVRPAMYDAYHRIENLTSGLPVEAYDVVGPICESTDTFGHDVPLNAVRRGDLLAIRSAGAYGEVMASQYNCRPLAGSVFSE